MLMTAATVVQVLQDLFMFYCMFYFTCDSSFTVQQNCNNNDTTTNDDEDDNNKIDFAK